MTDQGIRDCFDHRCGEDYYTRPRIVEFEEEDEAYEERRAREADQFKQGLEYQSKKTAHPCPADPEHPGEYEA